MNPVLVVVQFSDYDGPAVYSYPDSMSALAAAREIEDYDPQARAEVVSLDSVGQWIRPCAECGFEPEICDCEV